MYSKYNGYFRSGSGFNPDFSVVFVGIYFELNIIEKRKVMLHKKTR